MIYIIRQLAKLKSSSNLYILCAKKDVNWGRVYSCV